MKLPCGVWQGPGGGASTPRIRAAVPRRARIQGSHTFASLSSRLESTKEEEKSKDCLWQGPGGGASTPMIRLKLSVICLGTYGGPRGGAVSYERGTPVGLPPAEESVCRVRCPLTNYYLAGAWRRCINAEDSVEAERD